MLLNCFKHSQNFGVAIATITVTDRTTRVTINTTAVYRLIGRMASWIKPINRKTRNAQAR